MKIDRKDFKKTMGDLGESKTSFVLNGPNLNNIYSHEKIKKLF